jgi:hypothetical protein
MFAKLPRKTLGFRGRVNGAVDNPRSSCFSWHFMTMEAGSGEYPVGLWFRNLKPADPFIRGRLSLNYSMQLAAGVDTFRVELQEFWRLR